MTPSDPIGGIVPVNPNCDGNVRGLCVRRYPGHPHGCPNFGKRASCPPQAPLLADTLDLTRPVWLIYNAFPIGEHAARMRTAHPGWSDRQVYCCRYWQGTARKQLLMRIADFRLSGLSDEAMRVLRCPEACGCNVTATMATVGIRLEWPPREVAYQVALAGTPRKAGEA